MLPPNLSPRDWWKTLKTFININKKSNIPPIKHNDNVFSDDLIKANILNNYFITQTKIDDSNVVVPILPDFPNESCLENIVFTPEEVSSVLRSLTLGKASGPDSINNKILREAAGELAQPLCNLFNQSLELGKVPDIWKLANVCAVFKKDDPSLVQNYRPISLLSTIDKVLERLIFKQIYRHFEINNILTTAQSGFTPRDSTTNQLIDIYNTFCKALDAGKEIRVVFFDISKAFDRVWHRGLIQKLKSAGITGHLLNWFTDYLLNRQQCVVLPGAKSEFRVIGSGVPQGSILGPLLFLLYINDIVQEIQSTIKLFADDTSLYLVVDHPDNTARTLQSDIDKITRWSEKWLVNFNPKKTETMLVSRKIKKNNSP